MVERIFFYLIYIKPVQAERIITNRSLLTIFYENILSVRKLSVYLRAEKPEWVMRINY